MNDQERCEPILLSILFACHTVCLRLGKTYSVVETGMKELTVKGINNQHNKTYQFDRSSHCTSD